MDSGDTGLLASVRHLSASNAVIPCAEFQRLVELDNRPFPPTEWLEVVRFASAQCAQWQVRWQFSAAASPDTQAADELEKWTHAYAGVLETLVDIVPDARESLERSHRLLAAQRALERAEKSRPVDRFLSALLSRLAILFGRVGMNEVAGRLYTIALYPKGTIGRAGM